MDNQSPVAVGISRNAVLGRCRAICFRILQRYVDFNNSRFHYDDFIQAAFVVRVLPYGNHDTANKQSQGRDCITEN